MVGKRVTLDDLRGMQIYSCKQKDCAFSAADLEWQGRLIERARFWDRAADEAQANGDEEEARLREYAFFDMYNVANKLFFRFDDNSYRSWVCMCAAKLALAANFPAKAQECCEIALLEPYEPEAEEIRDILKQAIRQMQQSTR